MRTIVIDASQLTRPGANRGLGRYARSLISAVASLEDVAPVLYPGRNYRATRFVEFVDIPHRERFLFRHGPYYHATGALQLAPAHLATTVLSIQDLIPLDLIAYRRTGAKAAIFYSLARRVRVLMAQSHHTAGRISSRLAIPQDQIILAPLPVTKLPLVPAGACGCRALPHQGQTYASSVIDVVTPDPRKRLPWLLAAGRHLERTGIPLVLAGAGTEHIDARNIQGLGRLCDFHLGTFLAAASSFVYTTAYEGQGLPPQEALSVGTPVVAFRNSSLPEMIGPGALWLDDSGATRSRPELATASDPEGELIGACVSRIAAEPTLRARLSDAGSNHVAQFTAERFAAGLALAYERLLPPIL